jgi:hypothetical protein
VKKTDGIKPKIIRKGFHIRLSSCPIIPIAVPKIKHAKILVQKLPLTQFSINCGKKLLKKSTIILLLF